MDARTKFPRRKTEVGISGILVGSLIEFYASKEAMLEFSEFGRIHELGKERYRLFVDSRFDFSEVLEYIKNYG